jgi:hypothetical protein
MAYVAFDRVRDTTTTTGTGAVTVSGTPPTGYRTYSAVLSTNDTFQYFIAHRTADEWETGVATYSAANEITRTTVIESTNANAAVSFSAGTKDVVLGPLASKVVLTDMAQTLTGPKTFVAPVLGTPASGNLSNCTNIPVAQATGVLPVVNGGTGQTTEAEALGEMTQALTADATPDPAADYVMTYDASADTGKKVLLNDIITATEAQIESVIDTLANLTSVQGLTVTLADAGADAVLGWDDSASAYENLTAAEVQAIISPLPVANGGTGQTTEAEAIGEMVQALTADATPDWAADYIPSYDASADTGKKLLLSTVWREKVLTNRDYYVRSDGSNSNTGLVNNSGGAWLTLQYAYDYITQNLDFNGKTININLQASTTFTAGLEAAQGWVGSGQLLILGSGSTVISTTSANAIGVGATTVIKGTLGVGSLKLQTTTSGACISNFGVGRLTVGASVEFGAATGAQHMFAFGSSAVISSASAYTVTGAAAQHLFAYGGGTVVTGGGTLSGTLAFGPFAYASRLGYIEASGASFTGGTITGQRYYSEAGSVIFTNGGGASFFPGDVAGGTATGGQYI